MTAEAIVVTLLEAEAVAADAKAVRRKLRQMFVPGSQWQRTNDRFPTKLLDRTVSAFATKLIPAGEVVPVTVERALVDAIVFRLPDGQHSYLAYPDQQIVKAYFVYPKGVELHDSRGRLLRYVPV